VDSARPAEAYSQSTVGGASVGRKALRHIRAMLQLLAPLKTTFSIPKRAEKKKLPSSIQRFAWARLLLPPKRPQGLGRARLGCGETWGGGGVTNLSVNLRTRGMTTGGAEEVIDPNDT